MAGEKYIETLLRLRANTMIPSSASEAVGC